MTSSADREKWIRATVKAIRDRALRGDDERLRVCFDFAAACIALEEAMAVDAVDPVEREARSR